MSTNEPTRQEKKFDLWERKLLDLTTRNALLNTKVKGKTVPVFVKSASDIEDNLSSDKEYAIISRNAAGQSEATEEAPAACPTSRPVSCPIMGKVWDPFL